MPLPTISPEQRADALAKAMESRKARADAIAEVRKGSVSLADVLADPESPLRRAKVTQVLEALPRVGPVKVREAMEEIGIDPKRRIQGLGDRQRTALLGRFPA